MNTELKNRDVLNLPIEEFFVDENQPRKFFDEVALNELSDSIKKHGILEPIIYRIDQNQKKVIISGERRFRAAQKAGLKFIPAIFNDGNYEEIAIIENLLRQDLTPIEEAEALKKLKDEYNYTDKQLAEQIGKVRSTVSEILKLNTLPDEIKNDCKNKTDVTRNTLIKLSRIKDTQRMIDSYNKLTKSKVGDKINSSNSQKTTNYKMLMLSIKGLNSAILNYDNSEENDEKKNQLNNQLSELAKNINSFLNNRNIQ